MRLATGAVMLLLASACSRAPDAPAPAADAPVATPDSARAPAAVPPPPPAADAGTAWDRRLGNLPPDAAAVIERVAACNHFAGEFNGDRSERDREVAASIERLRCATIEDEAAAVRDLYGDRPDVMEALDLADRGLR